MKQFIVLVLYILSTTSIMAQFTEREIALIREGSADSTMRVLLVSNPEDYILLRQKCTDIDTLNNTEDVHVLINRMKVTMDAESGVGIAAPQVGISKNIFLFRRIDRPDYPVVVAINPRIVNHPDETVCFERDGCLSIPGISGNSVRYPWVEVEYTNENGEHIRERLEGYSRNGDFTGVIFQHEYDHLQGILFTDKLCPTETGE